MALAEELAGEKGVYTTHLRSEFEPILDAWMRRFVLGVMAKCLSWFPTINAPGRKTGGGQKKRWPF